MKAAKYTGWVPGLSLTAWIWTLEPALLPLGPYVSDPICLSFLIYEMEIIKWEGASQTFNPFLDTK